VDPVLTDPEVLSKQQKLNELSLSLAEAYEAVYEATARTERQAKLLQDLEGLVEPILEFRHRGVFDVQRYASISGSKDLASSSVLGFGGESLASEGLGTDGDSSIVFVDEDSSDPQHPQPSAPSPEAVDAGAEGAKGAKPKCFKLLTEKLQAAQEAKQLKSLIDAVNSTLDAEADLNSAEEARGTKGPGRNEVVEKVKGLVDLLQRQQEEINALKGSFSNSSLSASFADFEVSAVSAARSSYHLGESTFSTSSRRRSPLQSLAVPPQRRQNTPREKRKKAKTSLVAYCGTEGLISSTAESARMLIDLWEVFMLRSVAAITDVMRATLSALCLHSLLQQISRLLGLRSL